MSTTHKHVVRVMVPHVKLVHSGKLTDLLPDTIDLAETTFADALKVVNQIMREGAKTHACGDWRQQTVEHHVQRARLHLARLVNGDPQPVEDHLAHACTRLLMALTLRELVRGPQHG